MSESGMAIAAAFRKEGFYIYGLDKKEDYESICDRSFRFDLGEFVTNADYRVRFAQIFDEIIPRLSVLVNNEEVISEGRLHQIQLEEWQHSIDVHLTGPMMLCKFFLERLKQSKGTIINVTDLSNINDSRGGLAYPTSKNGLINLSTAMAKDLKGMVRVYSISYDPAQKNPQHAPKADSIRSEIARLSVLLAREALVHLNGQNLRLG